MRLYLALAWRNLWRNKKRTLISTASIFFAVIIALGMRCLQNGSYEYMIRSTVGLFTGYIQIHGVGYWDKRSLEESMSMSAEQLSQLAGLPHVTHVATRLESFVLISHGTATKVVNLIGTDPNLEDAMTGLRGKMISGAYLSATSTGALLAEGLAQKLGVTVGDSVVLFGQGYHGVTAAAQVPVHGILHFPTPQLNDALAYLALAQAQWLFSAPARLTSVALMIDSPRALASTTAAVQKLTDGSHEVMTWKDMLPELVQAIQADSAGGILMLFILYLVIGFGIFGTVMMMTAERLHEFGIIIAVGMKRLRLVAVTTIESVFISLVGAVAGVLAAIPLIGYLHRYPVHLTGDAAEAMLAFGLEPILPMSIAPGIFASQMLIVFVIGLLTAIYPILVIRKLDPVAAMRT